MPRDLRAARLDCWSERAVFVLREVFDVPYDEIAEAVGKSDATVRQIAHRAREQPSPRVTCRA